MYWQWMYTQRRTRLYHMCCICMNSTPVVLHFPLPYFMVTSCNNWFTHRNQNSMNSKWYWGYGWRYLCIWPHFGGRLGTIKNSCFTFKIFLAGPSICLHTSEIIFVLRFVYFLPLGIIFRNRSELCWNVEGGNWVNFNK